MKIHYTKKRLNYFLTFGILWIVLGTIAVIADTDSVLNYGYIIIGLLYFITYLFERSSQYLTIEGGLISKNLLIPKKVNLKEIIQIKKFAGDYVLKSEATELRINTELIEKRSLDKLDFILENLNLKTQ